jgi:hypothetical protein
MNTSSTFGSVAFTRFQAMREQHELKQKELNIKAVGGTSIELPMAITNLITGSEYWVTAKSNRYRKLIREGHLDDLLELAKLALAKDNPAHWFAKVCSVKAWERTLDFLKKLNDVRKKAAQVTKRIGDGLTNFVYKQIWAGKNVERWAVAAEEVRHDKPNQSIVKLFAYLCKQEGQGSSINNPA